MLEDPDRTEKRRTLQNVNLASSLYDRNWQQGIFGLGDLSSGHCFTFNQPTNNLIDDRTRGFEVFLHEKDQFWQGSDMENIGQTKPIDFEINNEFRVTFLLVKSGKINRKEVPCEVRRDQIQGQNSRV